MGIMTDAMNVSRLATLRRMCGYVENGTHDVVKIFQDDATREWIVKVGNRMWWGPTFNSAIDAAAPDFPPEG